MIQRIQTVYLLTIVALTTSALFLPLAFFATPDNIYNLYALGLRSVEGEMVQGSIYLFSLLVITALLPLVNIFLYKNRMLQIRLCVVEMVLLLGACIIMGVYLFLSYRVFSSLEISTQGFKVAMMFPLVAILFSYLSARAIFSDELLIRSVDRIR